MCPNTAGTVFHYALSEAELADTDANMEDFTFIPKKDTLQQFWYSGKALDVRIFECEFSLYFWVFKTFRCMYTITLGYCCYCW